MHMQAFSRLIIIFELKSRYLVLVYQLYLSISSFSRLFFWVVHSLTTFEPSSAGPIRGTNVALGIDWKRQICDLLSTSWNDKVLLTQSRHTPNFDGVVRVSSFVGGSVLAQSPLCFSYWRTQKPFFGFKGTLWFLFVSMQTPTHQLPLTCTSQ